MKTVKNSAGREIPLTIKGEKFRPFKKAEKNTCESKVTTLTDALKNCGLKDGMTLSFHHQLR
ncbi:MAG: citrate lyase subunit alpha, partial [Candidatus Thermoplasmatota archaeon]